MPDIAPHCEFAGPLEEKRRPNRRRPLRFRQACRLYITARGAGWKAQADNYAANAYFRQTHIGSGAAAAAQSKAVHKPKAFAHRRKKAAAHFRELHLASFVSVFLYSIVSRPMTQQQTQ
ncbi:hypothetical protein [Cohnella cellulosilytica]|uniref:Uncharacterized protein n=1 Tax=Cohnella cellulosilytica TaxID=986710 RepID=A0ABW2FS13_9BACL